MPPTAGFSLRGFKVAGATFVGFIPNGTATMCTPAQYETPDTALARRRACKHPARLQCSSIKGLVLGTCMAAIQRLDCMAC